jgi:hypothetical protein
LAVSAPNASNKQWQDYYNRANVHPSNPLSLISMVRQKFKNSCIGDATLAK